jgi:divalent metal cation (Fe/Co/Zn/Cd) transporter
MSARDSELLMGVRIEVITIIWMVVEMGVSIGAGIAARSVLLTAFGVDSLIELVSGSILLWRLSVESRDGDSKRVEQVENQATWVVAISLGLLCVYVFILSVGGLLTHAKPESSVIGMGIAAAALIIMPYLAVTKRRISKLLQSSALAGDAANSITCATMAGTVLVGLALNSLFGLWWVEYVAALFFLVWLIKETQEVFKEALEHNKEE